jgi:pimeloyl-ACP methyl ester carboxylesterase
MRSTILFSFLAAASLLALVSVEARPLWQREHVGALNHRLSRAERELTATEDIQPQWLTQKLDHQDLSSSVTFQQLFYVNDTYWNPFKPIIFLMIGGEGPLSPAYVAGHFITGELAAQYGAMNVALEHRFYGQSVPNNDSSTANLKYLSSAQALEDLVTFRLYLVQKYGPAEFVLFGGSYSGSLSAWARLKYPQLFVGSIAASAPLQAVLNFGRYFDVVSDSVGPQCSAQIAASTAMVEQMVQTPAGLNKLAQMFNTCAPIAQADIPNFVASLSGPIAETVQYNDDANRRDYDIPVICGLLENAPDALTGLVNLWNSYNNHTGVAGQCTDVSYSSYIQSMQATSAGRSWTWQTCIEFGYFQTGENSSLPFSKLISLEYFVQQCQDIFGIQGLTPNIDWINAYYGGDDIVTSNTCFTDGTIDPWHALGTYQNFVPQTFSDSILIQGTAHCADLYAPDPRDLPGLTAARAVQNLFIREWLSIGKASTHERLVLKE